MLRATHLEPITLDITNDTAVAALTKHIADDPEQRLLRALVNNAGRGVNAPAEALPLQRAPAVRRQLFSHVVVAQALSPALIQSRGAGVSISPVGGRMAIATYGRCAALKFALEAVSDALCREVGSLQVQVFVTEPGAVRTGMLERVAATGENVTREMCVE